MNDSKKHPLASAAADLASGESSNRIVGQVILIPADQILITDDPNRDPASFSDESFQRLKESIDATKGNTQPVQVEKLVNADGTAVPILTSGHRRVRACLETGHPVRAEVVEHAKDLLAQLLRRLAENALRKDLSPLERGRQIEHCFRHGVFKLESAASRTIGVDASDLNKLRRLAQLDPRIVAAFPRPSDLQFRHAKPLSKAMESNPEAVLAEADRIAGLAQKPRPGEVVARLTAAANEGCLGRSQTAPADLPLRCDGQAVGQVKVAKDGTLKIELATPLERKEREQLAKVIETFVRRRVLKLKPAATPKAEVQA